MFQVVTVIFSCEDIEKQASYSRFSNVLKKRLSCGEPCYSWLAYLKQKIPRG